MCKVVEGPKSVKTDRAVAPKEAYGLIARKGKRLENGPKWLSERRLFLRRGVLEYFRRQSSCCGKPSRSISLSTQIGHVVISGNNALVLDNVAIRIEVACG